MDPNPAQSPPVIARAYLELDNPQLWPLDQATASALPTDLVALGLRRALIATPLAAEPGGSLFFEVSDETTAVLVRRDPDGTVHGLRARAVTSARRTLAAGGRWEVWWDGGLVVQGTAPGAEARRYPVEDALDAPKQLFSWGEGRVGAIILASDGWHVWRVEEDAAPADLGMVAAYGDSVQVMTEACLVRRGDVVGLLGPDGVLAAPQLDFQYAPIKVFGAKVLYSPRSSGPQVWVDFARGVQRVLEGDYPFGTSSRFAHQTRFAAGGRGRLDMETGEERVVPGWDRSSLRYSTSDGLRMVGWDELGRELVVVEVATGDVLHRWPGHGPWLEGMAGDAFAFLVTDMGLIERVELDTGRTDTQPGYLFDVWEGGAFVVSNYFHTEDWVAGLGRTPRSLFENNDGLQLPRRVIRSSPRRLLFNPRDKSVVVDLELGTLWEGPPGLEVSGDRVWGCGRDTTFLDLEASPPQLHSGQTPGGRCTPWPARGAVTLEGEPLTAASVDGAQVVLRELSGYQRIDTRSEDLWATRDGGVYRFGPDGQQSLRWTLPEDAAGVWVHHVGGRALIGLEPDRVFSVASSGPVEGFELSSAAAAAVRSDRPTLDERGRVLVVEGHRVVAHGAGAEREVVLERPGEELQDLEARAGRWVAYVRGPDHATLWWSTSEGPQHVRLSDLAVDGALRWRDDALVMVETDAAQFAFEPARGRVTRLPRGARG
ncbi:MAG: hypothetical protein KC933_15295, partial [Myxococcales bacterium]|nr:hypothetical protein [Myxococcales bacterium]